MDFANSSKYGDAESIIRNRIIRYNKDHWQKITKSQKKLVGLVKKCCTFSYTPIGTPCSRLLKNKYEAKTASTAKAVNENETIDPAQPTETSQ